MVELQRCHECQAFLEIWCNVTVKNHFILSSRHLYCYFSPITTNKITLSCHKLNTKVYIVAEAWWSLMYNVRVSMTFFLKWNSVFIFLQIIWKIDQFFFYHYQMNNNLICLPTKKYPTIRKLEISAAIPWRCLHMPYKPIKPSTISSVWNN